jgi:hypothetical protein
MWWGVQNIVSGWKRSKIKVYISTQLVTVPGTHTCKHAHAHAHAHTHKHLLQACGWASDRGHIYKCINIICQDVTSTLQVKTTCHNQSFSAFLSKFEIAQECHCYHLWLETSDSASTEGPNVTVKNESFGVKITHLCIQCGFTYILWFI